MGLSQITRLISILNLILVFQVSISSHHDAHDARIYNEIVNIMADMERVFSSEYSCSLCFAFKFVSIKFKLRL